MTNGVRISSFAVFLFWANLSGVANGSVQLDSLAHTVTLSDKGSNLVLRLNYNGCCRLDRVIVRGREVAGGSGVASGICLDGQWFTTRTGIATPKVAVKGDTVTVTGIEFGKPGSEVVRETWQFAAHAEGIEWRITRRYSTAATLTDAAFPEWDFSNLFTWTGGMLDDGGVVWNKYLETPNATYGAHASTVTFWNREEDDCLRITPLLPRNQYGTVRFSHQPNNVFSFNYVVSGDELKPKHDLWRFLPDRQDLWAPFHVDAGTVSVEFMVEALDYDQAYNRGTFQGLDGASIRELLNTVARYGVIDSGLTGGNGWRSGYICLHEQWFGEMGLALDQPDYIANYSETLDYYRDHAIGPDGRVKARWCYGSWDAMPGTYDTNGFYEAQWGYLLDSQPDYVINAAEQFDLTGDRRWLGGQKAACERALNFLMRREVQHSGLVAMMTDSCKQQRGSDWIDIIWASYENALVNAELYEALELWAGAEDTLGDPDQAANYREFAARLKASFNRPISEGGFWDPTNQWYVYWRDKDGSIHGDNLVTPVNFAAIGYGLCDDPARQKAILDRIEAEMEKGKLFIWPLNIFPYQREEGAGSNFPFPKYENGDLFLSWGELGVRAYTAYNPALALKYVKNTLTRYGEDGLSYQRYLRGDQEGAGDDILAGNCMAIVGLYRDIYGIRPQWNRLCLDPHPTPELNGTEINYRLRNEEYELTIETNRSTIAVGGFEVRSAGSFAVEAVGNRLACFSGDQEKPALTLTRKTGADVTVDIGTWPETTDGECHWSITYPGQPVALRMVVSGLRPESVYEFQIDGAPTASLRTDAAGDITVEQARGQSKTIAFGLREEEAIANAVRTRRNGPH